MQAKPGRPTTSDRTPSGRSANGISDVLMITHNRPEYFALSLPALLESGDETLRVWVWQNGTNEAVTGIIDSYRNHKRLYRVHQSAENTGLHTPTNWLWSEADGEYIGKVDDDILVPNGWVSTLSQSHRRVPRLGALGCWGMQASDYDERLAPKKMSTYSGVTILESPWMAGSVYLMKRACVVDGGLLRQGDTFPGYCVGLAWLGWIHGWQVPLLLAENMDDPRSPHCMLKTEEDFQKAKPLTAKRYNLKTLEEWKDLNRKSAMGILRGGKKAGRCFSMRSALKRLAHKFRQGSKRIAA
jgi:glycosyltransferase involved in cell wall biosynthesis